MTGRTGTEHLRMIHRHSRYPGAGAVTALAQIRGGQVCCGLAGGGNAIVTTAALTGDIAVIEGRILPTTGVMAILTLRPGRDVTGRLTNRTHPIMTTAALTGDLAVIEGRTLPSTGVMTILALRS